MSEICIKDINAGVTTTPASFIKKAEDSYKGKIDFVIDGIRERGAHILFIAGPSGSGKTTTAAIIAKRLRELGRETFVISLDDFYRNIDDEGYPKNERDEPDFESVYALDLPLIESALLDVAANRPFSVPTFDFTTSRRSGMRSYPPIGSGVVIIEGLHALNPKVSRHLPEGAAYRLFISVSTNIVKESGQRIISGRKLRFIRRTVRDSIYRSTSPMQTLKLWWGVRMGEDQYLYPTRVYADVEIDTFHSYELSLLRPFVESLITPEMASESDFMKTVLAAARQVEPIDIGMLPPDSLLREFVPAR